MIAHLQNVQVVQEPVVGSGSEKRGQLGRALIQKREERDGGGDLPDDRLHMHPVFSKLGKRQGESPLPLPYMWQPRLKLR